MKSEITWTEPYCGVSHTNKINGVWCTINVYTRFTILERNLPKSEITLAELSFSSPSAAKKKGEEFMFEMTGALPKKIEINFPDCPYCEGMNIPKDVRKNGISKGVQRFWCMSCGKGFSGATKAKPVYSSQEPDYSR